MIFLFTILIMTVIIFTLNLTGLFYALKLWSDIFPPAELLTGIILIMVLVYSIFLSDHLYTYFKRFKNGLY